MLGVWGVRACAAAILLALSAPAGGLRAEPVVTALRVGEHPDKTRFVIEVTEAVDYTIFALADPYRLVIDLPGAVWRNHPEANPGARGLIHGYRYGPFTQGVSRIVLDLTGPVRVVRDFVLAPKEGHAHRVVIDLGAVAARDFRGSAMPAMPAAVVRLPKSRPGSSSVARVVVIDPGHGGVDPGAIGATGAYEKNITLAAARELSAALVATGRYRVAMTRDSDVFVSLRDRIKTARDAEGELFVSLHADVIPNRRVRGASVYTLSETASDKEAAELAAKENRADILAGVDLSDESDEVSSILIDLAQRETMNMSARYANILITEMRRRARVLRSSHRFAGFAVLKGPDVPSVLVELGYLSNRADERLLSSTAGRATLVEALVRSTDAYFRRRGELVELP